MEPKQSLILYSKPGCHLCKGLQNKLQQLKHLNFELEIRDITSNNDWFAAYQYEVPVLFHKSSLGEKDDSHAPHLVLHLSNLKKR